MGVVEKIDKEQVPINVSGNSIKCSKCGVVKAVRKEVFLRRAQNFGSIEKLLKEYKCLQCRDNVAKNGIICSGCGEVKAVRKVVYQKRIERYGTEEKLIANYLCRKCRRLVKHKKKMEERKKIRYGNNGGLRGGVSDDKMY